MELIKNLLCQACLFSFDSVDYLIQHLENISATDDLHSTTHFKCDICFVKCLGGINFCQHFKENHISDNFQHLKNNCFYLENQKEKKNICKFCNKRFLKPSDLLRHIRVHTNEKPFQCEHCNKTFKLKSTLNGHLKIHQPNADVKLFPCVFCNKNFLSFSALKLHIRIHTNETPFSCDADNCSQLFRTKKLMLTHYRNFHQSNFVNKKKLTVTAPTAKKILLETAAKITQLQEQHLNTSQNSAFSKIQKSVSKISKENEKTTAELIVIRVQVRSGSVVAGSIAGQPPTEIVLEPATLINFLQRNCFMYIPLKKTGLLLNLALSVDPRSVLSRLNHHFMSNKNLMSNHCFTSVVYPTTQHVVSNPPLPFSVICKVEGDINKLCGHMPSFLIECFLAFNQLNQYDAERRQYLAQSCLPMLCNNEVQYKTSEIQNFTFSKNETNFFSNIYKL